MSLTQNIATRGGHFYQSISDLAQRNYAQLSYTSELHSPTLTSSYLHVVGFPNEGVRKQNVTSLRLPALGTVYIYIYMHRYTPWHSICVCMYVCMYVCIYIYMYTYIHIYIHTYVTYIHIYISSDLRIAKGRIDQSLRNRPRPVSMAGSGK